MNVEEILKIAIPAILSIAALAWAIVAFIKTGVKVSADFSLGQINPGGILSIEHPASRATITRLQSAGSSAVDNSSMKEEVQENKNPTEEEFVPVNIVTVSNKGRTGVSVQRCTYAGDLGATSFHFEPQPGASPFGDHLPMRLEPGEGCTLIHAYPPMRQFLSAVMNDHGVSSSTWSIFLTLGTGKKVYVKANLQVDVATDSEVGGNYRMTRQIIHEELPSETGRGVRRGRR